MCQLAVSFVLLLSASAALRSSSFSCRLILALLGHTFSLLCCSVAALHVSCKSDSYHSYLRVPVQRSCLVHAALQRYFDIGILWLFTPEELISGKTDRQSDVSCYTELNFRRMSRLQYWLTHVTNMLWSWRNCWHLWFLTNLSYEATEWGTLTLYLDPRLGLLGDAGVSRLP